MGGRRRPPRSRPRARPRARPCRRARRPRARGPPGSGSGPAPVTAPSRARRARCRAALVSWPRAMLALPGMLGRHLSALIRALRPRHWLKNGFVLAPAVFAGHALDPAAMLKAVTVAAAFCLVSSAGYLVNDVFDREADRTDPVKRLRPVASGEMAVAAALAWAAVLYALAFAAAFGSGRWVLVLLVGYVALTLLYSTFLKTIAVVDAMALATGFLLRLVAGAVAIPVVISPWLIV